MQRLVTGAWIAVGALPDGCSYNEGVAAYTRINRAGVRVRPEERAYAELVRRVPITTSEIRRYSEVHRERMWSGGSTAGDDHDRRWLAHATEKSFGFSLWMRAAIRAVTIALVPESATKATWHAVDAIERWTIQDRLDKAAGDDTIGAAPPKASRILLALDQLLSNHLGLDNPMALPDARPLLPLIDLLVRHPALVDCADERQAVRDAVLGNLLLWLMVHPYLNQDAMTDFLTAATITACPLLRSSPTALP